MSYELTPTEQRAVARTLGVPVPSGNRTEAALLALRDPAPSVTERRADLCDVCEGCNYVSITPGRASEPWHRYLIRSAAVPPHRRAGWRPCPLCNADGARGYRDPGSGIEDRTARAR